MDRQLDRQLVGDGQRPDRHAGLTGAVVDQGRADAFGHHADRVIDESPDEAAGEKAAGIVDDDRCLLQLRHEVERARQGLVAGLLAAYHLDQGHAICRREEMQADEALGPVAGLGQQGDRQGRGIGRQHAVRRQHSIESARDFGLYRAVLEHRFDHQVGIAQQQVVGRRRDPLQDRIHLVLAQTAALHLLGQRFLGITVAAHCSVLVAVDQHHVDAALGCVQGNPAAHHAGADHAELAAFEGCNCGRAMQALLGPALVDEQGPDHAARDRAQRSYRQQVFALDAQALVDRQQAALVDAALDRQRGWQIALSRRNNHRVANNKTGRHSGVERVATRYLETLLIPGLGGMGLVEQPLPCSGQQPLWRRHRVDQTRLKRLGRSCRFAFEQPGQCCQHAEHTGQALGATGARQQADLDLG